MNYYLDFDNTLYETAKLTTLMIEAIASKISSEKGKNFNEILIETKENFNSTTDNIFSYAEKMAKKYEINPQETVESVNNILENGEKIVFEDAKRFLEKLKEKGHKCFILTYLPKSNQQYQMKKILGSGIAHYFDGIIMTTEYKFLLDINYKNGIFIDDDPRDLNGLFQSKAKKVIRIRKQNNKRSKIDIDNPEIEEYESFDDIKI